MTECVTKRIKKKNGDYLSVHSCEKGNTTKVKTAKIAFIATMLEDKGGILAVDNKSLLNMIGDSSNRYLIDNNSLNYNLETFLQTFPQVAISNLGGSELSINFENHNFIIFNDDNNVGIDALIQGSDIDLEYKSDLIQAKKIDLDDLFLGDVDCKLIGNNKVECKTKNQNDPNARIIMQNMFLMKDVISGGLIEMDTCQVSNQSLIEKDLDDMVFNFLYDNS